MVILELSLYLYLIRKGFIMLSITSEKGQGLVEYALIIVLIALVVILSVEFFGNTLINTFSFITSRISEVF